MSLRDHEGYLLIDHSQTIGLTQEDAIKAGLPLEAAKQKVFEAATYTCSHCQFVVVINPKRDRERAYCRGCDHLICDGCGVLRSNGAKCKTFKQIVDEVLEQAERPAQPTIILP